MTRRRIGSILLLVSLLCPLDAGASLSAQLQETGVTPEESGGGQSRTDGDPAKRLVDYKRAAGRYTIRRDSEPPVILTLKAEPILRLEQSAEGRVRRSALCLDSGRAPGGGGDVLPQDPGRGAFRRARVPVVRDGALVGILRRESGLELQCPRCGDWLPIPGSPKPAATPATRLRQMRTFAEEFRAELTDAKGTSPLRLLTQPLYRYEADRAEAPPTARCSPSSMRLTRKCSC